MAGKPIPLWNRLLQKSKVSGSCLLFFGKNNGNNYRSIYYDGKRDYAHRIVFKLVCGPIGKGYEIDHLCKNRNCINPDHLQAVTHRENLLRGDTLAAKCARKTHCPKNHLYDESNTRIDEGSRRCIICTNRDQKERRLRREIHVTRN